MVVAEVVKLFVSSILAIDDQSLVLGYGIGLAEILKDRGDRGLEALAQKLTLHISIFLVFSGQEIERSLAVARIHIPGRLKRVNEHVLE
jgi:hypothetical protein